MVASLAFALEFEAAFTSTHFVVCVVVVALILSLAYSQRFARLQAFQAYSQRFARSPFQLPRAPISNAFVCLIPGAGALLLCASSLKISVVFLSESLDVTVRFWAELINAKVRGCLEAGAHIKEAFFQQLLRGSGGNWRHCRAKD